MQSHRQSEFCANLMYHESDPGYLGYPTLKRLNGKISPRLGGLPSLADLAARLGGSPHLSCERNQIKMRDYNYGQAGYPTKESYLTYLGTPHPC